MATTAAPTGPAAKTALGAGLAATLAVVLLAGVIAAILGNQSCPSPNGSEPTGQAKTDIPADYLRLYQQAGQKFNIDWAFLASIGAQECNHGRCAGVNEVNASGCVGPMQVGVGGACGNFFARNKQDGDGDGRMDPRDPADAIYTAAYGLRKDKGAPPIGGSEAAYRRAACNYYGACEFIVPYADQVMARATAYGFQGGQATDLDAANALVDAQGAGCAQAADDLGAPGVPGKVRIAPDANFPGQPIAQVTLNFLAAMAGIADRELVVTTGTRHSKFTVDGGVSDHFDGHAADLGMAANGGTDDSPAGDRIMTACLIAAGMPRVEAIDSARRGGLFTLERDGLRIQCIWKTDVGGNHHNHVHAGAGPNP
jgi:hypothetical protein